MEEESRNLTVEVEVEVELDGADEVRSMAEEAASCLDRAVELLAQLDGRVITVRCRPSRPGTSRRRTGRSSAASGA